jgi:hypothetical protein
MAIVNVDRVQCGMILTGLNVVYNNKSFIEALQPVTNFDSKDLLSLIEEFENVVVELIASEYDKKGIQWKLVS